MEGENLEKGVFIDDLVRDKGADICFSEFLDLRIFCVGKGGLLCVKGHAALSGGDRVLGEVQRRCVRVQTRNAAQADAAGDDEADAPGTAATAE